MYQKNIIYNDYSKQHDKIKKKIEKIGTISQNTIAIIIKLSYYKHRRKDMEDLINEFEKLTQTDISSFSLEEQQNFYKNSIRDLDVVMNNKNIDLDFYEQLLEIKKNLLAKLYATELKTDEGE